MRAPLVDRFLPEHVDCEMSEPTATHTGAVYVWDYNCQITFIEPMPEPVVVPAP